MRTANPLSSWWGVYRAWISGAAPPRPAIRIASSLMAGSSLSGRGSPVTTSARSSGAGGMGEVYRARDPKLNRDVAIKVLPAGRRADPDRIARFRREAQVSASLNHPNIAHIHGIEEADGVAALVHRIRRRRRPGASASRTAPSRSMTPCRLRCRSPKRSKRPTNSESFIAI